MPGIFPKSHLAQFNLKYLQVKSNPISSSKTDNAITITILQILFSFFPFRDEVTPQESTVEEKDKRQRRGKKKSKAKRA